jgi:hypothetical protein
LLFVFIALLISGLQAGDIVKNIRKRAVESISGLNVVGGTTPLLLPIDPRVYNHTTGGGFWSNNVPYLDGHLFSCFDRFSFVVSLTTDTTFVTSATITLNFQTDPSIKFAGVVNNCNQKDPACVSISSNAMVLTTGASGNLFAVQVGRLAKGSTMILRLDFTFSCPQISSDTITNVLQLSEGVTPLVPTSRKFATTTMPVPTINAM